jgi:hypothetical protein
MLDLTGGQVRRTRVAISLRVANDSSVTVVGTRYSAIELRNKVEQLLTEGTQVDLDFSNLTVTQSFADALLGPLAMRYGRAILDMLRFGGCSDQVRSVIQLVLSDRLKPETRKGFEGQEPPGTGR